MFFLAKNVFFRLQKPRVFGVISALKSKLKELERMEAEKSLSEQQEEKSPKKAVSMLERLVIPPVEALKEKEKSRQ